MLIVLVVGLGGLALCVGLGLLFMADVARQRAAAIARLAHVEAIDISPAPLADSWTMLDDMQLARYASRFHVP